MQEIFRTGRIRFDLDFVLRMELRLSRFEVSSTMSTSSKYGWAIGLIMIGLVLAMPFRKAGSQSLVPQGEMAAGPSPAASMDSTASSIEDAKLDSKSLLPNSPPSVSVIDLEEKSNPVVEPPSLSVPDSFQTKPTVEIVQSDQAASLRSVDFSNAMPNRSLPKSVGPYRMKKVPASRFLPASQSSGTAVISNASQSRNVIQYRLRDGDTLRSIAARYLGNSNRYEEILADNRHILTNGEGFLPIGQYITIIAQ